MSIATIREFLRHPDCIIFAGSGISRWSGLPSWSGLLEELAEHLEREGHTADLVRREIRNGDLLQAASYGVSKLTPASFGSFVRRVTRVGEVGPHGIHEALVKLGPTSFITTNYDPLIEQALAIWRPESFFAGPITNKHLVELADILSARSSHFVFKPHGDAGDTSSVILTREHYRLLLPGGERHNALEALKTLLITRPVLYVGFGLRDPDFLYLRDLLLNIYQGAIRDHWAIMPDIEPDEIEYWRSEYGIRLHGYATCTHEDGTRDHSGLIALLEELARPGTGEMPAVRSTEALSVAREAERVLALTRYASGLARRYSLTSAPIEVRVSQARYDTSNVMRFGEFEGWTTTRYLIQGPRSAYLIGLPGAGKSFALRQAAHLLASQLLQACIDDELKKVPALPVIVDLKLFRGDLRSLIDEELPAGFTVEQLCGDLPLKLFLDAFNEMSSEHLESGALFKALDALEKEIGPFAFALASRTMDGLIERSEHSSVYEIDRFDRRHVDAVLAEHEIVLAGRFAEDVRWLLSRPFFLQLVVEGLVEVPADPSPRDIYASYIGRIQTQFSVRFDTDLQLLPVFAQVAFRAMENESEAFPVAWLFDSLAACTNNDPSLNSKDIVNWLVGRGVLISYTGRRASFVHQSVTEFCAATELARRARLDTISLRQTITSKKWDQCLFLALGLMDTEKAREVLDDAVQTDIRLAINAVRFAEEGQSAAVTTLLEVLLARVKGEYPSGLRWISLRNLPASQDHGVLLRQLVDVRGSIGGEAALLLAKIEGPKIKSVLLDMLEQYADDFNFSVNGVSPALKPLLDIADLPRLFKIGEFWLASGDDDSYSAIGDALGVFDAQSLLAALPVPVDELSPKMAALLGDALRERADAESFAVLADLLLVHPTSVTSSFALALGPRDQGPIEKYACLDERHVAAIWRARSAESLWDSALKRVCTARPDLARHVTELAGRSGGIEAIALRFCAGTKRELLFDSVEQLLRQDDSVLKDEPFSIFDLKELDWRGHEELFARCLSRNLPKLRKALLHSPFEIHSTTLKRNEVGIALMKLVIDTVGEDSAEEQWWIERRLGEAVAFLGNEEVRDYCLGALSKGPEHLCNWVKNCYIERAEGLSTDLLDDETLAVLLADLNVPGRISQHWYNPLGAIATDRFVQERLMPLAAGAPLHFRENMQQVIISAGDRLGKRYRMPD